MIAVDTNILVYAHRADSPHHEAAAAALRELAGGPAPWAVPWPCWHEFLAVITHPRIYDPPTPLPLALDEAQMLATAPGVVLLHETGDHARVLDRLVGDGRALGPKIHDARIAAICLAHGVSSLWSADRDFSWFPQLPVTNPLLERGAGK